MGRGLLALTWLLCLALSACARDDDRTVVRLWAMGREGEVLAELLPDFEREHPQIRVELQQIPWTSAHEKLLTAFAADALPDLCPLGNTWVAEFAALGALEPLQPYVAASAQVQQADYFDGIWDTNVIEGVLSGVPWYVDTRLLFYRTDLLAEAGFSAPPRSWDEWRQAMAAITAQGNGQRHAMLLPLNEFEQLLSLALQQDDPLLREHDGRGNFRSPGFRQALDFYASIFAQGWAPAVSETQISNVWDEFGKGRFAFYVSGPWNIREFRRRLPAQVQDRWMTAPLPGPEGLGAGIAGGSSLVMFRGSARKPEAWKLVEFLSRPEVQQRFHGLTGNLPPRRSAWDGAALQEDRYAQAFRDQLERVKPTPKVLEWERIVQEMRLVSERVVRGGQAQEAAVRELDLRVDAVLEKRRWIMARADAQRAAAPAVGSGRVAP